MKFAALLSFSATAYGLAFDGPLPTPVTALVYEALNGWTPKPTGEPRALPELFRRQQKANSAICGYLDGDSDFPITCSAGACIFETAKNWFGCCPGGNSASCNIVTKCINSASVSKCLEDTSCYNDPLAMACTESAAPNCINMYAKISGGTMNHWVCGASATSIGVLASSVSQSSASVKPSGTGNVTPVQQAGPKSSAGGLQPATVGVAGATSTGGAPGPMPTVQALLGVAGGLAGAFAIFL